MVPTENDSLPKIGNPAIRALASVGISRLSQLKRMSESELMTLHGFGPYALKKIKQSLKEKGWSLKEG